MSGGGRARARGVSPGGGVSWLGSRVPPCTPRGLEEGTPRRPGAKQELHAGKARRCARGCEAEAGRRSRSREAAGGLHSERVVWFMFGAFLWPPRGDRNAGGE